ncbi:Unknown protein [Striga hermonthica]|uniref:Reverse transcriptase zinc-binding domain-containing protein n=1 Tax=Striga hermonthica TaxID=68872 RepID=A0A9N7NEN0_STRHE|nr:Unknown protein [Striga hermonthica]
MKLGWSLLTQPHVLWVRLLVAKYKLVPAAMDMDFVFPQGSPLIRALHKVWRFVCNGVRWSVGDGTTIRFWRDNWTHSPRPLIYEALSPIPEQQLDWPVSSYVGASGQWRWDLFGHLLPAAVSLRIAAFLPPSREAGLDSRYWGFSENGQFTTKSAYSYLFGTHQPTASDRSSWRIIWKWVGPQRIRQFLWLVVQEKLLTNVERRRRHLTDSSTCPLCGRGEESTLHCLRDCVKAALVWRKLLPLRAGKLCSVSRYGRSGGAAMRRSFQK